MAVGVVGIHGVISCLAAERTRGNGIRMVLAAGGGVSRLSLRHGFLLAAAGITAGIAAAAAVTRVMSTLLSGVSALEGATRS